MKNLFSLLLSSFLIVSTLGSCNAQPTSKEAGSGKIKWMSFEQAVAACQKNPKKIFIDISTVWCGWCKKMDATTFEDSSVVSYMNAHYYAVKLDAETKDTIHFQDKQFVFRSEYKANELALSLLNGQMSYPSFVFMDEQFRLLSPLQGYQTVEQFKPVIKYFGENTYLTVKWEDYVKGVGN